jgi:MFS family permease
MMQEEPEQGLLGPKVAGEEKENIRMSFFATLRRSKLTITLVVMLAACLDMLFYSVVIPMVPLIKQRFDVSQSWIGFLFSVYPIAGFVTTTLFVRVADSYGRKIPMLVGLAVLLASTLLFAYGTFFWVLVIARMLQGIASGITWTSGMALVADAHPSGAQGAVYGRVMTAGGVGSLAGPVFGGFFLEISGNRMEVPFLISCAFIALDLLARMFVIEPARPPVKPPPAPPGEAGRSRTPSSHKGPWAVMTDKWIVMLCCANALAQAVFTAVDATLPDYLSEKFTLDALGLGLLYSSTLLSYTVACPLVGWLTDKIPQHRITVMMLSSLCFVPLLPLLDLTPSLGLVITGFVVMGGLGAAIFTAHPPAVNEIIDRKYDGAYYGAGSALTNAAWNVGAVLGPMVTSVLDDIFSMAVALGTLAAILGLFALFFLVAVLRKREPVAGERIQELADFLPSHWTAETVAAVKVVPLESVSD